MHVLSVVHGPLVRAELFGEVTEAEGHEVVEWDIAAQGAPPREGYDAVMVFGGKQNVGEEAIHPWLHAEYEALREWVESGTPLLGVCLGAQTIAHALGGAVQEVGKPLFGFYDTELTDEGAADPVLGTLPRRFESFNANGYWFRPPPGAVELATGPVPQAFRVGGRAWATQFHPEVRAHQVAAWLTDERETTRPREVILAEAEEKLPRWHEQGAALCRAFLAEAER